MLLTGDPEELRVGVSQLRDGARASPAASALQLVRGAGVDLLRGEHLQGAVAQERVGLDGLGWKGEGNDGDNIPTNIGIVRGTVSVATIVVVNAGVEIWLL